MKKLLPLILSSIILITTSQAAPTAAELYITENLGPNFINDVKTVKKNIYFILEYTSKCKSLGFVHKRMPCEQLEENSQKVVKIQETLFKNVLLLTRGKLNLPLYQNAEGMADADYKTNKGNIIKRINEKNEGFLSNDYENALDSLIHFINQYPLAFKPVPEPKVESKCVNLDDENLCFSF